MATFTGFEEGDNSTIRNDVQAAYQLARRCLTSLLHVGPQMHEYQINRRENLQRRSGIGPQPGPAPGPLDRSTELLLDRVFGSPRAGPGSSPGNQSLILELLNDAFAINAAELRRRDSLLEEIRETFARFPIYLARVNVQFAAGQRSPNKWDSAAFVLVRRPNEIFVRNSFFEIPFSRERAALLIHECVHLRYPDNPDCGHPGGRGTFQLNGRGRVGIAPEQAVRNPYCYEYYALNLP